MSYCKYRTPCGVCTVRTDADPSPNVHYCKAEAKCEEQPTGIRKPKRCSKCKYHYDYLIEDEPCKSCIAYSNYEESERK